MTDLSLQERLARYLKNHANVWFPKADLADLARAKTGATGESIGRRLRILAEASTMTMLIAQRTSAEHVRAIELLEGGMVVVERREKNHAHYKYIPPATRTVRRVEVVNGIAREIYEQQPTNV